ncbi:MAG: hypothetical protein H6581_14845 [Bacteroidia bacterium]|nr:hypothetical protein [Bacteroidia bacterium]
MKPYLILLLLLLGGLTQAQDISYKILSEEPPKTPRLSLNTDLIQLDFLQHSLDATSFNLGVWGFYELAPDRIGLQFTVRKSWLLLGQMAQKGLPGNLETEGGAYLVLSNAIRRRQTKVVLNREYGGTTYSTNYKGDVVSSRTETVTYIMIPSDKRKLFMVRGGLIRKSNGNGTDYLGDEYSYADNPDWVKFSTTGVYLGISGRTFTSIFIDTEKYGVQFNSIGRDLYADLMILPINTFRDLEGNYIGPLIRTYQKALPLGFRVGYRIFQSDKKAKTGKLFGMCGSFEGGYRPYTGIYLNAGLGMTILK